jgi:hypothetical protein
MMGGEKMGYRSKRERERKNEGWDRERERKQRWTHMGRRCSDDE